MIFDLIAVEDPVKEAQSWQALEDLARRRKARALRRASGRVDAGELTQGTIGKGLGISQPAVSKYLKKAKTEPLPRDGFSGADPYEIVELYAVQVITREQMINELSRWNYASQPRTEGQHDDLLPELGGTFEQVGRAYDEGLIDADAYDEILRNTAKPGPRG